MRLKISMDAIGNWKALGAVLILGGLSACSVAGPVADELNPYGDGNAVSIPGERNTTAILGTAGGAGGKEAEKARQALEVLGSYRRGLAPQPVYPVIKPAEVRLMWVPDHLNRHGDLIPAHYYYLRVLPDDWAVQDAFEIEQRLHPDQTQYQGGGVVPAGSSTTAEPPAPGGGAGSLGTGGAGTATPWVYKETK